MIQTGTQQNPRPRRPVHVCNVCDAIWEGPVAPPQVCPKCGGNAGWKGGEVGDMPGHVGGRIFVPGTDRPMTRAFLCQGCGKLNVARGSAPDPTQCAQCGRADALVEALNGNNPPPAPPPQPAQPRPRATVGNHGPRELAEQAALGLAGGAPQPPRVPPVHVPRGAEGSGAALAAAMAGVTTTLAENLAPAISGRPEIPETSISAEEYRSEWVNERVTRWVERAPASELVPENLPALWDFFERLYDEGQRRKHLP
jgi:hypothetical protein